MITPSPPPPPIPRSPTHRASAVWELEHGLHDSRRRAFQLGLGDDLVHEPDLKSLPGAEQLGILCGQVDAEVWSFSFDSVRF